ncbi:MAG: GNAT family N-acetyltransferase [Bdellovibrionota bacterium]
MNITTADPKFILRFAKPEDVPLVLKFIFDLAEFEKLRDSVVATEADVHEALFGERPAAEAVIGFYDGVPAAFAIFFHNFSTFLCKPGLYLEDLYVNPEFRGKGLGTILLSYLAWLARDRGCARFEWWVLDWNESAIRFYRSLGARPMDEWTVQRVAGEALEALANSFQPHNG